jgi:hypothetical protein
MGIFRDEAPTMHDSGHVSHHEHHVESHVPSDKSPLPKVLGVSNTSTPQ